jgi:hypothetical protein
MSLCCEKDSRRDDVRRRKGWNGLDYVEVGHDQITLKVYFLGKLPPELHKKEKHSRLERYLRLEGGRRITDVEIVDVTPKPDPNPEKDDYLVVRLSKAGDSSTYTLRLVDVRHIDPRYDHVDFQFKLDCPTDLDCVPACACEPPELPEPEINYLAKDYAGFRQLILDRLSLLLPEWKERHVPDLGITLVELLAYTGDYLSYYQDAVGTEAYLDTARKRISVRRHARLVDYKLHEGCNARTWICLEVGSDLPLDPSETAFITAPDDRHLPPSSVLTWDDIRDVPARAYEVFEPLLVNRPEPIQLRSAHNEIHFYTWGDRECCVERNSTSATLLDYWVATEHPIPDQQGQQQQHKKQPSASETGAEAGQRALHLHPGDVLILEEILGPRTGLPADADPARRHPVRLTRVNPGEDQLYRGEDGRPTPIVEITWAEEDALPFPFCVSTVGIAPECRYLTDVSVARGNVILVDHGKTQEPEDLGTVVPLDVDAVCDCVGEPGEVQITSARFEASLSKAPLTFRQRFPLKPLCGQKAIAAGSMLKQDPRLALPQIWLASQPAKPWESQYDLIESRPDNWHFAVEMDEDGVAHLRFGDGELGAQPPAAMTITARYRIGNGTEGNVGAESIIAMVMKNRLSGVAVTVRNPLPAQGGTNPEPLAEAKLFAPHLFRKRIERAITAVDYEEIAERDARVSAASAELAWTGSWYEADVAIDPVGREDLPRVMVRDIEGCLQRYRRIGHDLSVRQASYVPLHLQLKVCALPHYQPGHVKAALLARFGTRRLAGGTRGFFHPDELSFGQGIYLSSIVAAAQAIPGVESVTVTRFQRLFYPPNGELEAGLLPLATWEIAQLDNDPDFPERGRLEIEVRGGR